MVNLVLELLPVEEHNLVVEQSKDERDAKAPKTYLGNVKVVWTNGDNVATAPREDGAPAPAKAAVAEPDDLPF